MPLTPQRVNKPLLSATRDAAAAHSAPRVKSQFETACRGPAL